MYNEFQQMLTQIIKTDLVIDLSIPLFRQVHFGHQLPL